MEPDLGGNAAHYLYVLLMYLLLHVLVQRIRPFLNDLIGPFQSSFIPGRETADNALLAQEIVHSTMHVKKGQHGYMMYKIRLRESIRYT